MDQKSLCEQIVEREGLVTWMYLDTAKPPVVTCGVGHALFTVDDCLKLEWDQPEAQVRADYMKVKASVEGYKASFYAPLTKSRLTEAFARELLQRDIDREVGLVKRHFPFFDTFPEPVRAVITDISFNCGGNFPAEWPNFKAAILAGDWKKAAGHSHRKGISEARNKEIRELLLSA